MLKDALYYHDLGLSVIPLHGVENKICTCGNESCPNPGKHPRLKWKKSSSERLTRAQLERWWKRAPDSNIGIVTGKVSGISVLDIDGDVGLASLKEAGFEFSEIPVTAASRTGGGGYHLFFKYSDTAKTKAGILPKVDTRSDGGMIVAPPSRHEEGSRYAWLPERKIGTLELAEFDFTALEGGKSKKKKAKKKEHSPLWYEKYLSGVDKGERNVSATRLAGRYFSLGLTKNEVRFMLEAWNHQNHPPMNEEEMERTLDSIEKREYEVENKDVISLISSITKMELTAVKRISGDEPQFVLIFKEGRCTVTVAQLLSPKGFQQAVAEATNMLIKKLSAKTVPTHDRLAQLIMEAAEDVDAGIEATSVGEMITLLKDFVRGQSTIPDTDQGDEIPIHGSFRANGKLWMPLEDLVYRGGQRWGIRIPMRSMAQRLRALGVKKKVFTLPDGNDKPMWGVNSESLDALRGEE